MKAFYSCIDGSLPAPQPVQHLVIRDRVQKAGGAVTFYGGEDVAAVAAQPFIRLKLARLKETQLDGVVFYTLRQFGRGTRFNYRLLLEILDLGLEVLFACEGITLRVRSDVETLFPFLEANDYTTRRQRDPNWLRLVREIDLAAVPTAAADLTTQHICLA